jgi:hypothetical protein
VGVAFLLPAEEHVLDHFEGVFVVSFLNQHLCPSSPDGQTVLSGAKRSLGGRMQDLVASSQLSSLLQHSRILQPYLRKSTLC